VTACKSGEAGLKAMQKTAFDLVLNGFTHAWHRWHGSVEPCPRDLAGCTCDYDYRPCHIRFSGRCDESRCLSLHRQTVPSGGSARSGTRALEMRRIKRENCELKLRIESLSNQTTIITQDLGMQRLLETARQIAGTACSVVIHGESGTGKELLARFIHQNSQRSEGPFIAFNCGALHEEIATSELFGHEKGAFTGAVATKIGLFEAAEGGTLFLDEVAELPLLMQVKLLRVLQERELMRVGSVSPVEINVRVVAASNRDLKQPSQTDTCATIFIFD